VFKYPLDIVLKDTYSHVILFYNHVYEY